MSNTIGLTLPAPPATPAPARQADRARAATSPGAHNPSQSVQAGAPKSRQPSFDETLRARGNPESKPRQEPQPERASSSQAEAKEGSAKQDDAAPRADARETAQADAPPKPAPDPKQDGQQSEPESVEIPDTPEGATQTTPPAEAGEESGSVGASASMKVVNGVRAEAVPAIPQARPVAAPAAEQIQPTSAPAQPNIASNPATQQQGTATPPAPAPSQEPESASPARPAAPTRAHAEADAPPQRESTAAATVKPVVEQAQSAPSHAAEQATPSESVGAQQKHAAAMHAAPMVRPQGEPQPRLATDTAAIAQGIERREEDAPPRPQTAHRADRHPGAADALAQHTPDHQPKGEGDDAPPHDNPATRQAALRLERFARAAEPESPPRFEAPVRVETPAPAQGSAATSESATGPQVVRIGADSAHKAPSPAPAPPPQPTANQAMNQAESQASLSAARGLLAAVNQRGGTMHMRLSPESLGAMRIEMTVQHGAVSAQLHTSTAEARELLMRNIETLRASLEAKGLSVQRLEVQLAPGGQGGLAGQAGNQSGQHAGQNGQGGPHSGSQQQQGQGASTEGSRSFAHDAGGEQSRGSFDQHPRRSNERGEQWQAAQRDDPRSFETVLRLGVNAVA